MSGSHTLSWISSLMLGVAVLGWTTAGETSNPLLSARDLPRDVLNECDPTACVAEDEFRSDWVGRTAQGSLFVVSRTVCLPESCAHWLVEKGRGTTRVLLDLPGTFRFDRVSGHYPVIELRTRDGSDDTLRVRFEWNGREYARTDTQRLYEVDGTECGTRDECRSLAERALKKNDVDRALRIWEQVHGVSWI